MKFSILIPVYNAQKYVDTCLRTLTEMCDHEIVVVDDGSKDETGAICDKYAEQFPDRVKVIHQENHGQLSSRCNAIKAATGDYVIFLDVDDALEPDIFDILTDIIKRHNEPDMVIYSFYYDEDGKLRESEPLYEGEKEFSGEEKKELYKKFFTATKLNNVWTKAVKRTVFDGEYPDYNKYAKLRCAEDKLHSMGMMTNAERIVYTDKPLYRYKLVADSVTRRFTVDAIDRFNTTAMYGEQLAYIGKWGLEMPEWKLRLDAGYIHSAIWTLDQFYYKVKTKAEREEVLRYDWQSFVPAECAQNFKDNPYISSAVKDIYAMLTNRNYSGLKRHFFKKKLSNKLKTIKRKLIK